MKKWFARRRAAAAMCVLVGGMCMQTSGCTLQTQDLLGSLVLSVASTFISSYVNDVLNVPPSFAF